MERLNIRSDSPDWRAKILGNLSYTPFKIGDREFKCVEAPLQGIKFGDKQRREEIFAMKGMDALKAGRQVTYAIASGQNFYVHWDNMMIPYNSIEHRLLIAMFIGEKVRQNLEVQQALLETKNFFIYHDVGEEHIYTSLPERFFIEVLLAERRKLEKLHEISLIFN